MDTTNEREARTQGCGILLVMCVWVPATLTFDVIVGHAVFHQCRAWGFAEVPGTVTTSQVRADGDSQQLEVRYRYSVDGREYTGNRYCYGMMGVGDNSWRRVQAGLPPGAAVTVYHNPADPKDATLTRGPQGTHLFLGNFLVPFNAVVVVVVMNWLGRRKEGPWWSATRWGCTSFAVVWGLVAVVSLFVTVLFAGFNPPVWAGMIPWLVGPALGLVVFSAAVLLVRRSEQIHKIK